MRRRQFFRFLAGGAAAAACAAVGLPALPAAKRAIRVGFPTLDWVSLNSRSMTGIVETLSQTNDILADLWSVADLEDSRSPVSLGKGGT